MAEGFLCNSVTNRATKPFASNIMEGGSHYRAGGAYVGTFYGNGGGGASWNPGNSYVGSGGGAGGIVRAVRNFQNRLNHNPGNSWPILQRWRIR